MEPKDRIEEGYPPLDLEDDDYYADSEDFAIDDLYPEDDPEMDFINSLDDDDPYPHWDMPFDDDEDDIFDNLEGLDESDLY